MVCPCGRAGHVLARVTKCGSNPNFLRSTADFKKLVLEALTATRGLEKHYFFCESMYGWQSTSEAGINDIIKFPSRRLSRFFIDQIVISYN